MGDEVVTLRPFEEADMPFLELLSKDPEAVGSFEWFGFSNPHAREERWKADGLLGAESSALGVVVSGTLAGIASWGAARRGGPDGACWEIGVALLPEHRGRGFGVTAHRTLVDYLFAYTMANRIEAITDSENLAEQRTLEKVGFYREAVLRGAAFQNGGWRDLVMYARLRDDSAAHVQTEVTTEKGVKGLDGLDGHRGGND